MNKIVNVRAVALITAVFSLLLTPAGAEEKEPHQAAMMVTESEAAASLQDLALYVAERINETYYKPWMLSEAAQVYFETGNKERALMILQEARRIADGLDKASYRTDALVGIAGVYNKAGERQRAVEVAGSVQSVVPRMKVFSDIAASCVKDNDREGALSVLRQGIEGVTREDDDTYDSAWEIVSASFFSSGDGKKAREEASSIKSPYHRLRAFSKMAAAALVEGKKDEAGVLTDEAAKMILSLTEEDERADSFCILAPLWEKTGHGGKAMQSAEEAERIAVYGKSVKMKPEMLAGAAVAYLALGDIESAARVAAAVKDSVVAPRILSEVAAAYALAGNTDKAEELFSRAVEMVSFVKSKYSQAGVMRGMVRNYLETGDAEGAENVIVLMRDDYNKPRALCDTAVFLSGKGDKAGASACFAEALEISAGIKDNFYKAWAIAVIALKYHEAGMVPDERAAAWIKRISGEVTPL